jgi:Uma2 family endonuclease
MADTATVPMTSEQLLELPDDGWRYELRRGELIRMSPTGAVHGDVTGELSARMRLYAREHRLGRVFGAETGFRLSAAPDTVRAPDVAFVHTERLAGGVPEGYFEGAPDIAVEVVSPSDRAADVREKVAEYLAAGSQLVWVVYPRLRGVSVFRADGSTGELTASDVLVGEDVLPGFRCPVNDLFAD